MIIVENLSVLMHIVLSDWRELFCTVLRQTAIVILKLASSGEVGANTLLPLGFLKAMC